MRNTKSIGYLLRSARECSKTLGFPRSYALHFNNIWLSAPLSQLDCDAWLRSPDHLLRTLQQIRVETSARGSQLSMARQRAMQGRCFSTSVADGIQFFASERAGPVQRSS